MPPQVAAGIFGVFILWLFARDSRLHPGVSKAIYIPLIWAFIVGSRPLTMWPIAATLGLSSGEVGADNYVEGSPADSMLFLVLIVSGGIVLARRQVDFGGIFRNNRALFLYFVYLGFSVLWADNTFVSFKRWIKDLGNVVMVMVVLSEADPATAVKAFLSRVAFLLLPLSVLAIKYYPDLSRYYDEWTYQPRYCGISTDKNLLGMSLFVGSISTVWMLLQILDRPWTKKEKRKQAFGYCIVLVFGAWLLSKAQSATALSCTILSSGILIGLRIPFVRTHVNRLGIFAAVTVVLAVLSEIVLGMGTFLVGLLGRDLTFTGRTDIWAAVLKVPINPLLGVGFYSFWSPERMAKISEGYNGLINEAHNGYLETYLNSGIIGVVLLLFMLAAAAKSIKSAVVAGDGFGGLRFAFLMTCVVYAFSEAIFNRLSVLWLMLLMAAIEFPKPAYQPVEMEQEPVSETAEVSGDLSGAEPAPADSALGIPSPA